MGQRPTTSPMVGSDHYKISHKIFSVQPCVWKRSSRGRHPVTPNDLLRIWEERRGGTCQFGHNAKSQGQCIAKVHALQTKSHPTIQPSSKDQDNPTWWMGGSDCRSYWTFTHERKVGRQLARPLQGDKSNQTRYILTRIIGRCAPGPILERRQPQEILCLMFVTFNRGIYNRLVAKCSQSAYLIMTRTTRLN